MIETGPNQSFVDYLTVGEAADFLGVSPWTLRNWDNAGKLKPRRHPVSGYRMYHRDELASLLTSDAMTGRRRRVLAPNIDWNEIGGREHFVQFYEEEKFLINSVCAYAERALITGEGVVIIATKQHRTRMQRVLRRRDVDLKAASVAGQMVWLDAEETLAKFMDGDFPDRERFVSSVGEVVNQLCEKWPRVRAFGEMVAILWENGKQEAAVKLEFLWNELGKRLGFTLYCAYPIETFRDSPSDVSISDVCGCHGRVIPAESFSKLRSVEEKLQSIAILQQKAQRLEAEIDQRKAAERELADFIENALEGLHKVGPDGIILWANKAELDMLGYHEDEYIGRHVADFHVDRDAIEMILQRLLKGENIYNQPAALRCKDGTVKHVLIHSNAYFERGSFRYSRCFTRDMTDVRSADRDRAMLAAIIESSQDAIISKTLDGIIRSWNAGAERLFGYTAEEAIGQSITMIIPPERHHEEAQILGRLKRGERIENYDTVRMAKDGRLLDISITVSPMRDAAGNLIGASKIARDISERKQSEAALRDSEERFRRLVELLPVGVYTCDASGAVTYSNGQAETLWGRSPALNDSVERFCGSFKLFAPSGEYVPHDQCPMAVALRESTQFRNREVEIERPDGSRITALVNIDPIHDQDGKVVGAINVFHDISPLKEAERKLRAEDKRKDEFLATLAHELRNPLAPIRNGLQILRMSGQSTAAAGHIHEMMERQVLHLVRLVDDLLELSRISRGKIDLRRAPVSVGDVINHAVETTKPFIDSSQHSLEITLPSDQLVVEGDLVRLSQVVSNLLNNAAKYTNKGGRIKLALFAAGREAVISVSDNGIGIPREMLARVFDMFAQVENPLRRSQDGLGIGLSLVKSLVQMHGGSVEARSDGLGMGTEILVRLPLARNTKALSQALVTSSTTDIQAPSVQRILCVHDNRDSADSLGTMLKFLGADVRVTYDGPSALEAIKICRPSIVLLDIGMPGMTGLDVARKIREDAANKDMLLIALTGWGNEDDRHRSREAGFDHHLVKPVDVSALQALLRSHGN